MLGIHLNGNDTLTSLHTGSGSDVLAESASHALRNTVSTCASGLLVLSKNVVREGVNSQSIALSTGFVTDGGVGNDTSSLECCVADLDVVVRPKFDDNLELSSFSSTSVADVELVNSVVGNTTDVLTSCVCWTFQSAVHDCWFTCHRYPFKQPCDQCSPYDISA
jgi:hypothetical protein